MALNLLVQEIGPHLSHTFGPGYAKLAKEGVGFQHPGLLFGGIQIPTVLDPGCYFAPDICLARNGFRSDRLISARHPKD